MFVVVSRLGSLVTFALLLLFAVAVVVSLLAGDLEYTVLSGLCFVFVAWFAGASRSRR